MSEMRESYGAYWYDAGTWKRERPWVGETTETVPLSEALVAKGWNSEPSLSWQMGGFELYVFEPDDGNPAASDRDDIPFDYLLSVQTRKRLQLVWLADLPSLLMVLQDFRRTVGDMEPVLEYPERALAAEEVGPGEEGDIAACVAERAD